MNDSGIYKHRFNFYSVGLFLLLVNPHMSKSKKTSSPQKHEHESQHPDYKECPDCEDCQGCDCECHQAESDDCQDDCCCDTGPGKLSPEMTNAMLENTASQVWIKLFMDECEKEWKRVSGKQISKKAKEAVAKAKKDWDERLKP